MRLPASSLLLALVTPVAMLAVIAAAHPRRPAVAARVLGDDDLRAIAIAPRDLDPTYALTLEMASTNTDLARHFVDPGRAEALLDGWGRVNGFEAYVANSEAGTASGAPFQIVSTIERFADADGARARWFGRGHLFGDWAASPVAVTSVKGPRVGVNSAASRLLLTDGAGRTFVVYSVTFWRATGVVEVTTAAYKHSDDGGRRVRQLARIMDERLRTLAGGRDTGPAASARRLIIGDTEWRPRGPAELRWQISDRIARIPGLGGVAVSMDELMRQVAEASAAIRQAGATMEQ